MIVTILSFPFWVLTMIFIIPVFISMSIMLSIRYLSFQKGIKYTIEFVRG